jgi:hypothetical protein
MLRLEDHPLVSCEEGGPPEYRPQMDGFACMTCSGVSHRRSSSGQPCQLFNYPRRPKVIGDALEQSRLLSPFLRLIHQPFVEISLAFAVRLAAKPVISFSIQVPSQAIIV